MSTAPIPDEPAPPLVSAEAAPAEPVLASVPSESKEEELASTEAAAAALGSSFPGRALIGWMADEEAALTLAGRHQDRADDEGFRTRAQTAREAVAARPAGIEQDGLVEPPPPELAAHIVQLGQQPFSANMLADGWEVKLVDLSRVCSLQQTVRSEHATARVADLDPTDVGALAALTLPVAAMDEAIPVQFDDVRNTWLINAANPNLRVVGRFGGPIQEGMPPGFGFNIAIVPSFLNVACHHGRYVLRDGYHRAYGLLARGITRVPAFVRDYGVGDLGVNAGLFGTDVYLGERPPLLPDFLDDAVAADVPIPAAQKMIVVQAMELTPLT